MRDRPDWAKRRREKHDFQGSFRPNPYRRRLRGNLWEKHGSIYPGGQTEVRGCPVRFRVQRVSGSKGYRARAGKPV